MSNEYPFLRSYEGLVPALDSNQDELIAEWKTPNNRGYSELWVTRIIYDSDWKTKELRVAPIIEFYSIGEIGQFVSAYYVDTLLGRDYDDGYGSGLDLYGGVPSWKIEAHYMDQIRAWAEKVAKTYEG